MASKEEAAPAVAPEDEVVAVEAAEAPAIPYGAGVSEDFLRPQPAND